MLNRLYNKILVSVVIFVFVSMTIIPFTNGIVCKKNFDIKIFNVSISQKYNDTTSLTFYSFEKIETKEFTVQLSTNTAKDIYNMYEKLIYEMAHHPLDDHTFSLKQKFYDQLNKKGLIPEEVTKEEFNAMLTPPMIHQKLNTGNLFNNIFPSAKSSSMASAFFCSITSAGSGKTTPIVILPRPRGIILWRGIEGEETTATAVGAIRTGKGFIALGEQNGIAIGFTGAGLTYGTPVGTVYIFSGYAMYTMVTAEYIQDYPANREPIISDPTPGGETMDVPLSRSKLSFRIEDPDEDRMDYTVTTEPNIGSGSGTNKKDGVYTIPISNLEYDKEYRWTIEVSDGNFNVQKKYRFFTEGRPAFNPFNEGWQFRKMITINHNNVAGNLNDFPVLISITDSDLRDKAQIDDDDILFMDSTGVANKLYHEIEEYDGSTGKLVAWLKIPILSSVTDTNLWMYYGNPSSSSQQIIGKVWDSDYIHIWHLGDGLIDSAGTDDGTNHGTDIVTGKIGKARDFEHSEQDYIDCGDMAQPADGSLTTMTWECWIKPEEQDTEMMNKYDTSGEDFVSYHIEFWNEGKLKIYTYSAWKVSTGGETDNSYSEVDKWIYLTATYNLGGTNNIDVFINGDEVAFTQSSNSANVMWNTQVADEIGRGRYEAGTDYTDGIIDEIRWSKKVRNDAWIKTSYNTMNDPKSFMNFGPEEMAP